MPNVTIPIHVDIVDVVDKLVAAAEQVRDALPYRPFLSISWENDIPQSVKQFVGDLHGRCVGVNGTDVYVVDVDGLDLICKLWDDDLEEGTGDTFTVPWDDLQSVVLY
jgi:hypothetical protein